MPLIVPALRMAYVFINVFDTFKTLRLPPPSSKNNGQPSARAMSQRKRAMKGCMSVWIVWGCFAVYERTVDSMVRLFVPFYDEVKSLVILFFLFTRARGAEPIFLHVVRPFIKPYAATLDASLEFASTFGDLFILFTMIPVHFVLNHYRRWTSSGAKSTQAKQSAAETPKSTNGSGKSAQRSKSAMPAFEVEPTRSSRLKGARSDATRGTTSSRGRTAQDPPARQTFVRTKSTGIPRPATRASRSRPQAEDSDVAPPPYEVWHPPASAYEADTSTNPSGLPTPPADNPPPFEETTPSRPAAAVDDWRQYPAFPSAYPATPLPVPPRLPALNVKASLADVPEDSMDDQLPPGLPGHTTSEMPEGFHESLKSSHEFPDSDSADDLSDDVNGTQEDSFVADGMDVDEEETGDEDEDDIEEEDDFDVTLRTPRHKKHLREAVAAARPLASNSSESLASRSTKLSTTDYESSLLTRSNSVASTTLTTDSASVAGKKRRLPRTDSTKSGAAIGNKAHRIRIKPAADTKALGARPSAVQLQSRLRAAAREHPDSSANVSADEGEDRSGGSGSDGSGDPSDAKRRRVPGVPGDRLPRPATTRGDSNRTIRASSRKTVVDASTIRAQTSRRPTSRALEQEGNASTVRARRPASTMETKTRGATGR